jgi:hypothetical protein
MVMSVKTCFKYRRWNKYEEVPDWNYVLLKTRKKKGDKYYYEAEFLEWHYNKYEYKNTFFSSSQLNKISSEYSGTKYSRYTKKEFEYFNIEEWNSTVAKILLIK